VAKGIALEDECSARCQVCVIPETTGFRTVAGKRGEKMMVIGDSRVDETSCEDREESERDRAAHKPWHRLCVPLPFWRHH
jgi:hypothetical protein